MFTIKKTFGHEFGLSCCYRQWRAESHCRFIHGYALAVTFEIYARELTKEKWVFDFGGFEKIKDFLKHWFDHTLIVAEDDPQGQRFRDLGGTIYSDQIADTRTLPHVGCEAFAKFIFDHCQPIINQQSNHCQPIINQQSNRYAELISITVSEHGANSATYGE
jgi:6-pyruvoyltetrahydropterin/6-carboxytetrahydropterin synthase